MNILFCNYEYPPLGGGGGVINAQVAQELAKRHNITVLTSQGLGLPKESIEEGVRVVRAPVYFRKASATANFNSMLAFMPMGVLEGRRLLSAGKFDVINTHFVLPTGPVGDALAHHAGIPNILSVHGGDLYDPSKLTSPHRHAILRAWVRRLIRRADVVVGQSLNTLENMHKYYTPEIMGLRIPLGIARPACYNAARSDFGYTAEDVLLITVGRLVARKAVDQLVQMVSRLANPKVHLIVVGSGPEQENLQAQAAALGVQDQIHFMGFVDDCEKFRLLEIADIYVSTSQHEGFSLSYLEGMVKGLPIIAYDYGGHTDYLVDGETGYLVPLNNLDQFILCTQKMIAEPGLRAAVRQTNLAIVEDYFIDSTATRYEELFNLTVEKFRRVRTMGALRSRVAPLE